MHCQNLHVNSSAEEIVFLLTDDTFRCIMQKKDDMCVIFVVNFRITIIKRPDAMPTFIRPKKTQVPHASLYKDLLDCLKAGCSVACGYDKRTADLVIDIITCPARYLNVAVTLVNGGKCQAFYVFPVNAVEID